MDFNKLRKEHNPYTIDHFEITSGQIYSSDQDLWHEKWKNHYLSLLSKKITSSDGVEIYDHARLNHLFGNQFWPNYRKSSEAVRRRYIRTARECKDGIKRSNFIVLDHDKPFGHEDWIGILPPPQFVVINPVSAKCHLVYVLDRMYDVSSDSFKELSAFMVEALGAEKGNPISFRSPFFITGRRKRHEEFRKGRRESDYHFVIHHDVETYSLVQLVEEFISMNNSEDSDNTRTDSVVCEESFNDGRTLNVTTSHSITSDIGIMTKRGQQVINTVISSSDPEFLGRADQLFHAVRMIAYSIGSSITHQQCLSIAKEQNIRLFNGHPHGVLPPSEVQSTAKSVFGFMEKKFVGTKTKSRMELHEQGVFAAKCRWLYHSRQVGETIAVAAKRVGKSPRSLHRYKANGSLQLVGKEVVIKTNERLKDAALRLGISYRSTKRKKASGEIVLVDGIWRLAPFCHYAGSVKHGPANDDQIDYHSADHYSCDYDPDRWMARKALAPH